MARQFSIPVVVLVTAVWACAGSTPDAAAQLRIASAPQADPPALEAPRQNPFRIFRAARQTGVQPSQFIAQVPPQLPAPEEEAELFDAPGDDLPPAPQGEMLPPPPGQLAEPAVPGEVIYEDDVVSDAGLLPFGDVPLVDESAILYSTNSWFRRGFWYSYQDVLVLLRTENEELLIAADQTDTGQNRNRPLLSSKQVDFTYEPGMRLTLGRFLGQDIVNRDHTLEFTFLGLFNHEARAVLEGSFPGQVDTALGPSIEFLNSPSEGFFGVVGPPVAGFSDANRQTIIHESDLNSFELNFRMLGRPRRDRIALQPNGAWMRHSTSSRLKSLLVGLRTVSIDDSFRYISQYTDPTQNAGDYLVKTNNDLVGLQVGTEITQLYNNWSCGVRFKAGALYNFAERDSHLDVLSTPAGGETTRTLRTEELSKQNLAPLLELGFVGAYQIRPNLTGRVAYDLLYVTGIATAVENLGLGPEFPRMEVTGDAFYHGLSVGVEMLW